MMGGRRVAALALLLFPPALQAQVAFTARASTLGLGAELSVRAGAGFGFRLGGNYFQISRDVNIQDNRYTATAHLENGTALLDLYPFGGSFHLSGGAILNYNEGRLAAHLPVTVNGRAYTQAEVTQLSGTVTFKRTAPYLGLGFAGRSRIAILLDLGVGFTGTPLVALGATTSLQGAEQTEFSTRLTQEQQTVQDEINSHSWLKYHPVLSLGLKLGF